MSTTTAESPPDSQSNTLQRSHAASERNATSHRSNTVSPHRRLQSQRVSRAGLVYGSSFSRGSCLDGARRFAADLEDMWYDSERFQLDHINEVLSKLNDGSLDDEIWGKIVVMERCKRIAKAYLRKTTVIVDGGEEEFDGKTLGFNYFNNPLRDEYTKELRSKIGDGVIIKMDNQGNIKAMARGSTPVFVQGWKDGKTHCTSDKVIRNQGKLITKTGTGAVSDEDRVVKIFDMRRFKQCVERDPYESESDARNLLLKTCVRVALVKDGGAADPMKTPCWFMIINLVALDMLKTKLPSVCISPILNPIHSNTESSRLSRIMSQVSLVPPHHSASASDLYSNPAALTQLIAAAVQQANNTYVSSQPAGLNVEQLAQLANTLTNPAVLAAAVQQNFQKGHHASTNLSMSTSTSSAIGPNRRQRRNRSFSDSDSELETRTAPIRGPSANYGSTTGSSSGISGVGHSTPRSKGAKSMEALHQQSKSPRRESESLKAPQVGNKDRLGRPLRPRLSESLFENPKQPAETTAVKPWKSCASTTSDYDSNREVFDSGSWSSNSRVSTNSRDDEEPRSYSPSIGSESDQHLAVPENQDDGRRNSVPNAIAEQAAEIARQRTNNTNMLRRVSSSYGQTAGKTYQPIYAKRTLLRRRESGKRVSKHEDRAPPSMSVVAAAVAALGGASEMSTAKIARSAVASTITDARRCPSSRTSTPPPPPSAQPATPTKRNSRSQKSQQFPKPSFNEFSPRQSSQQRPPSNFNRQRALRAQLSLPTNTSTAATVAAGATRICIESPATSPSPSTPTTTTRADSRSSSRAVEAAGTGASRESATFRFEQQSRSGEVLPRDSLRPIPQLPTAHPEQLQSREQPRDPCFVGVNPHDDRSTTESELVSRGVGAVCSPRRPVPASSASSVSRSNTSVFRNLLAAFRRSRSPPSNPDRRAPPRSVELGRRVLPYSEVQSPDPYPHHLHPQYHHRPSISRAATHHHRSCTNLEIREQPQFDRMQLLRDRRHYVWNGPVSGGPPTRSLAVVPTAESELALQQQPLPGAGTRPGQQLPFDPHNNNNYLEVRHRAYNPGSGHTSEVLHRTSSPHRESGGRASSHSVRRWPRQWNDGYNPINGTVSAQLPWNTNTKGNSTSVCDINPIWGTRSHSTAATHRHPRGRQPLWAASSPPTCAPYETSTRSSNNRDFMHGEPAAGGPPPRRRY